MLSEIQDWESQKSGAGLTVRKRKDGAKMVAVRVDTKPAEAIP